MVNKVLFITLSNIGDVVLSLPALDALSQEFPQAQFTVICAERSKEIFVGNPAIHKLIVYDKRQRFSQKLKLFYVLNKERFDLVADMRNSFLGAMLWVKYKTSAFLNIPKEIKHMRQRHLYKIKNLLKTGCAGIKNKSFYISGLAEEKINRILEKNNIHKNDKIIVVSPGSRSHTKRWPKERFVELINRLIREFSVKIILTGDAHDAPINRYIAQNACGPLLDLSVQTSLGELASLLMKARLLITNDSATLHIASYLNIPVVAIFGITDDQAYGPWSDNCAVAKKEIFCRPCRKAQCRFKTLECMSLVKVEDVFNQVNKLLNCQSVLPAQDDYKRILVVRTDRIGDVLLSTPVIKALRQRYAHAYIAMMVSPYARQIVEGNPYLDEVIIYDKDNQHKSWLASFQFSRHLKKKKFDLAVILHPTNRAHLVSFLSAIPKRVGYNCKLGFLLTDRIEHLKQCGEKHELEYNLDLLKYLGITVQDKDLFMPLGDSAQGWAQALLEAEGVNSTDKILAVHPGASCRSKLWPAERFAAAADKLSQKYGFKVLVVAGPKDISAAAELNRHMQAPVVNLAGKTSVAQLACLLKRSSLFISNDSGPVHIASAVGTPVISIFGRNQAGLGPRRWGPRGKKDKFLHKEIGCIECRAHNCIKEFACLKAISVDDVLAAADSILRK